MNFILDADIITCYKRTPKKDKNKHMGLYSDPRIKVIKIKVIFTTLELGPCISLGTAS